MFQFQKIWFPDGEKHFPEWMAKNGELVNGRGTYQIKKWRACLPWIRNWRTAVDVGAHVGLWSMHMARQFQAVHAFEPVTAFSDCWKRNVPGLGEVLHSCALGAAPGRVAMVIPSLPGGLDTGGTHVGGAGDIEMRTLDSFCFRDVDFIKLDCEGYELEVLKGARETLISCEPCVIVEQKTHKLKPNFGITGTPAVDYLRGLGAHLRTAISGDIDACKAAKIPIRVGVNEGSIIERKDKLKRMKELGAVFSQHKNGYLLAIMIAKLEEYLDIFHERGFEDICISAKSMDAALVIDAYTEIARRFPYPLHLGVTHAGPKETGTIRSVVALGSLLTQGIGDTIRISYANDPVYEVQDALELLYCLGLKTRIGVDLIACPTCGRIQVDLFTLIQDVRKALAEKITVPMKVAVMGCIVNGPGEAEGADVAVFAGDRRGIIYVQGEKVANVPEPEILDRLLAECLKFQDDVNAGRTKLGEKKVQIIPPDPIGELGSGWEKVAAGMVGTPLTVGKSS